MVEIKPDYDFAQQLDLNCLNCRMGYTPDNQAQLSSLKQRGQHHDDEGKVIEALAQKCRTCFSKGKPPGEAIADTHSCLYRGGIRAKNR
ncbi:MAG: hypothetical protein ACPLKP_00880 [Microgenomates group bacterium]